jgi:hypothetical protein
MLVDDCREQALLRAEVVLNRGDVPLIRLARDSSKRDPIKTFLREELLRGIPDF